MKSITKNLLYFAIVFFAGSILFRYGLSNLLEQHKFDIVWGLAVLYFIYNFVSGWYFGKRDYEHLPLYDIGFRFHFVAYLLFNSTSIAWFVLGFHFPQYETLSVVYTTALFWGIALAVHFILFLIARKNGIKGINKSEIFE